MLLLYCNSYTLIPLALHSNFSISELRHFFIPLLLLVIRVLSPNKYWITNIYEKFKCRVSSVHEVSVLPRIMQHLQDSSFYGRSAGAVFQYCGSNFPLYLLTFWRIEHNLACESKCYRCFVENTNTVKK